MAVGNVSAFGLGQIAGGMFVQPYCMSLPEYMLHIVKAELSMKAVPKGCLSFFLLCGVS